MWLIWLDLHFLVFSTLFETVLYSTQKDQIELTDIFLITYSQLIAIIIYNWRQNLSRI